MADTRELVNFLEQRDPFQVNHTLQNIVTGVTAEASVNVDFAKDVREKILNDMTGKCIQEKGPSCYIK